MRMKITVDLLESTFEVKMTVLQRVDTYAIISPPPRQTPGQLLNNEFPFTVGSSLQWLSPRPLS